jgi:hypothetical protein
MLKEWLLQLISFSPPYYFFYLSVCNIDPAIPDLVLKFAGAAGYKYKRCLSVEFGGDTGIIFLISAGN